VARLAIGKEFLAEYAKLDRDDLELGSGAGPAFRKERAGRKASEQLH
jgi:hypothetical protein